MVALLNEKATQTAQVPGDVPRGDCVLIHKVDLLPIRPVEVERFRRAPSMPSNPAVHGVSSFSRQWRCLQAWYSGCSTA